MLFSDLGHCVSIPHLSSVSFMIVLPSVEKTMKDIRSWGLEERENVQWDREYTNPHYPPDWLQLRPLLIDRLSDHLPYWWCWTTFIYRSHSPDKFVCEMIHKVINLIPVMLHTTRPEHNINTSFIKNHFLFNLFFSIFLLLTNICSRSYFFDKVSGEMECPIFHSLRNQNSHKKPK